MRAARALLLRLMSLLNKGRKDRELAEELESHLGMQIEDNLRAGMSPEQALIEAVFRDFAHAMRQVRRTPGFAAVVVLTPALGIGANTAIFSLLYGVLLRPLPYRSMRARSVRRRPPLCRCPETDLLWR
ncbi:MAG: permease prefix domain 1-containing protein [Bryobacteraceae bacterium]